MTETELMKDIIEEAGASTHDLPDNLTSTLLKRIKDAVSGGGSGGGVSSWNDLTDKPFGETAVTILPQTTVNFEYMEEVGMPIAFIEPLAIPDEGAECTVVYNGETYTCVYANGALGNAGAMMGGEDTGEPFIIMPESEPPFIVPLTEITSATVSVETKKIQPIPEKYFEKCPEVNLSSIGEIGLGGVADATSPIVFDELCSIAERYGYIKFILILGDGILPNDVVNNYIMGTVTVICSSIIFSDTIYPMKCICAFGKYTLHLDFAENADTGTTLVSVAVRHNQ